MVGEAMEEFVTNLSGEKTRKLTNSFNYFDALLTGTITSLTMQLRNILQWTTFQMLLYAV